MMLVAINGRAKTRALIPPSYDKSTAKWGARADIRSLRAVIAGHGRGYWPGAFFLLHGLSGHCGGLESRRSSAFSPYSDSILADFSGRGCLAWIVRRSGYLWSSAVSWLSSLDRQGLKHSNQGVYVVRARVISRLHSS